MNYQIRKSFHRGTALAAASVNSFRSRLAYILLALLLAWGFTPVYAQQAPPDPVTTTVNINVADAATLSEALNGVGDSRARDIVRYREEFGPFTTVEQLAEVKGIGMSTLDKNRALITLD